METLSHATIISGDAGAAADKALELAAFALCSGPGPRPCGTCRDCLKLSRGVHPDCIHVSRQNDDRGKPKREIYVDQIRELASGAQILPNEAANKVYIIHDAGTMNPNAQNAFLKLLEEPPSFVRFLLLCDNAGQLLETVRSRCAGIHVRQADDQPGPEARALAEKYFACAGAGNAVGLLSFLNANSELSNAEAAEFVDACRAMLADMLSGRLPDLRLSHGELLRLASLLAKARDYLRSNVGVKHVFGLLAAKTLPLC